MKKWIARAILILLLLAIYGGVFWGLPVLFTFGNSALETVWHFHAVVGGVALFLVGFNWAARNSKW